MDSSKLNPLRKNGKDCLLCVNRKKLIIATPEEKVRQKFVTELIDRYGYPEEMIRVEFPLSAFDKSLKGRVDILVLGKNKVDDNYHSLLLVECKEPNVPLTESVFEQALSYDDVLAPKVTVVTNGNETVALQWDDKENEYVEINLIPSYADLIELDYFNPKEVVNLNWVRPNHLEPESKAFKSVLDNFGEDSRTELHSFFANLIGLFYEEKEEISSLNVGTVTFNKDCLIRFTTFGNASGGGFTGEYRSVLVTDDAGDSQIVSMSLMGRIKTTNHPKYGNSKGHTLLLVAVDDFDKSHLSLELALDRYIKIEGGMFSIWHDGTLTVGKKGRVKNQSVIDFIQHEKPSLIRDNKVFLGSLDNSKSFTWSSQEVNEFISNVIDYALLRDRFRRTQ
ncbi:hypothetical protein TH61_16235 [Rufibacter sp. DG15C]|uniref:type I restriction enzyme HsdR N-terminal domain-containing protein n=1 Tax=Rufibacter sp. DG15C TaxID=1379909 RepID=UPI00078C5940|nr:type I restriction enzyme HsdR N-terminal domain-containing protein [Rufibacter sp. DG15C]AMM52425.1 hypothetical protein TH61_16235 [Rufibacter sp. DG15C]